MNKILEFLRNMKFSFNTNGFSVELDGLGSILIFLSVIFIIVYWIGWSIYHLMRHVL